MIQVRLRLGIAAVAVCLLVTLPGVPQAAATGSASKVEAGLLSQPDNKQLVFWVTFRAQADLAAAPTVTDFADRGKLVVDRLHGSADTSQTGIADLLSGRGIEHESFWISNSMRVTGLKKLALELADRPEVEQVLADPTFALPAPQPGDSVPDSIEWNVGAIRAPEVWAGFGATGEGIVVANLDTGVQFDHPALVNHYRGNLGGSFDHNYNWYDPAGICGNPSTAPCDNYGHGTHTMGTMVGDDGAGGNRIGVAPGAKWIAAKGCEYNSCSASSLLAAGQWLLAPTDLNGQNPRPDLRPNIVNNSWGGGPQNPFFQDIVTSWVAAGIFPVFSNGNAGPSCASAGSPADYADSYAVGADDSSGTIAGFSSRGAAALATVKPDIVAPGVGVRSSIPGNGYAVYSGTSMAAPHVAATVALMWSAAPNLVSDVAATRAILDDTAIDTSDMSCGGTAGDNGVWGQGRLDAYAAVDQSPRGPTGTLVGVVRAAGQPLPGARVRSVAAGQPPHVSLTGPGGEFRQRLAAGTYQVVVDGFGYAASQADVVIRENEITTSDHVLVPVPRYALSGTVRDLSGTAVGGARVSVSGTSLPTQPTDAGGTFRFADIPQGRYDIAVSGQGCASDASLGVQIDADTVVDVTLDRKTDGFGYSCRSVAPAYIEADTVLPLTGDDDVSSVSLPFPFTYYGASYTGVQVSTNGVLGLAGLTSTYSNVALPDPGPPNAAIYPLWDDLYLDANSSIRTTVLGSAPDRRFVVEWRNVAFYANTSLRIDFEVVLDQGGGIVLQYRHVTDDPMVRGASATIGLEDATGSTGFDYADNRVVLTSPETAIRFDTTSGGANGAPIAEDDVATTPEDTSTTITVLGNDHDPDGDPLHVTAVFNGQGSSSVVKPDGTIAYTPGPDFYGTDVVSYNIADGRGGADTGRISISVSPVNDAPRPVDDYASVLQGNSVTVAVLTNDWEPDGDALAVTSVSDPAHGTTRINPDRTVTYTPDAGFVGRESFSYVIDDGHGGVAQAWVNVGVDTKKSLEVPLTLWTYPTTALDGVGAWVVPFNEPTAAPGQMDPSYLYSHSFWFSDVRASGTVSLGTGAVGKTASMTITRPNGTTDRAQVAYPWVAGRAYFLFVYHLGGGRWGGWVIDGTTGVWTSVGALTVSPAHTTLYPASVTHVSWTGPATGDCAAYPLADTLVLPTYGYSGGIPRTASLAPAATSAADCPTTTVNGPGWVYYVVGSSP